MLSQVPVAGVARWKAAPKAVATKKAVPFHWEVHSSIANVATGTQWLALLETSSSNCLVTANKTS